MKKIAVILLVCLFSVVCFTACEWTASTEKIGSVPSENAVDGTSGNTAEEGTVLEIEAYPASNADGDGAPVYNVVGYVEFGYYPQTRATKDALKQMSKATDFTGYYVSAFDNEHYARITVADVYAMYGDDGKNGYEFMDENPIVGLEEYYFKVEPIKWRVYAQLDIEGGFKNLSLISDRILDSSEFLGRLSYHENFEDGEFYGESGEYANNYAYSDLRKWLNGTFYKTAISAWAKREGTNVNEDLLVERSVSEVTSEFDKDNEFDKVFALTYAEAKLMEIGSKSILTAELSDYARCRGTFMSIVPEVYGNGRWWLATAGNTSYRVAYVLDHIPTGEKAAAGAVVASGESAGSTFMGVRPAIKLSVDSFFEILQEEEEK